MKVRNALIDSCTKKAQNGAAQSHSGWEGRTSWSRPAASGWTRSRRKHSSEEASRDAHAFQGQGIAGRSVLKAKGLPGWGCWDEALRQAGCRA